MTSAEIVEKARKVVEGIPDLAEFYKEYLKEGVYQSIHIPCVITGHFDILVFDGEDLEWYIQVEDGCIFKLSDDYEDNTKLKF